jgi:hypothetical protein
MAGKVSMITMEWDDMPSGAQDALRGAADVISGVASMLRDIKEAAELGGEG